MEYKWVTEKRSKEKRINKSIFIIGSIIILIVFVIVYNIELIKTVVVIKQDVVIENLPNEFEGFTILQISDLHSSTFGENQEVLINLINNENYDIIAFTGDMMQKDDDNYKAFLDLLNGINKSDSSFYLAGNNGPFVFENEEFRFNYESSKDLVLTEDGKILKEYGLKFMDDVYSIVRGESTLWISELISSKEFEEKTLGQAKDEDIKIALTHYPMNESIYCNGSIDIPDYNLVIAGHYHGGQWRIPLLGAVFISDVNGSPWFPSKERVSGLAKWGDYYQYVSRGLGASGDYKWMRFRLFNKPEINLIRLTNKKVNI